MRVIINIDGGSRGNPGPGASAFVIKDSNGKILSQEGYFIPHCTNNQAEYTALKLALIKAAELGATELDIISDSLLLVKQYLGEYKIKNPDLAARMQEIRTLARAFSIRIRHVLRHLNKEPDALANKAMDLKQSVGFNPIKHFPAPTAPAVQPDNTVNGVAVEIVRHEGQPSGQTQPASAQAAPSPKPAAAGPAQTDDAAQKMLAPATAPETTATPQQAAPPASGKTQSRAADKKKTGQHVQPLLFEDL